MRPIILLTTLILLFSAGCSPISVQTDFDDQVDFAGYKKYQWLPPKQKPKNEHIAERIKEAIEYRLGRKGFEKQEELGKPDFLVTFHGRITQKIDVVVTDYGYTDWRGVRATKTEVYRYDEGTLVLDIIDAKTRQLVWRGVGVGAVNAASRDEMIDQAVTEILKRFPPKKK